MWNENNEKPKMLNWYILSIRNEGSTAERIEFLGFLCLNLEFRWFWQNCEQFKSTQLKSFQIFSAIEKWMIFSLSLSLNLWTIYLLLSERKYSIFRFYFHHRNLVVLRWIYWTCAILSCVRLSFMKKKKPISMHNVRAAYPSQWWDVTNNTTSILIRYTQQNSLSVLHG